MTQRIESRLQANGWRYVLAFILILGAATLIYINTFEFPFAFDDQHTIQENFKIRNLDYFHSIRVMLLPRPLADYTFALNYHFGRLHVFGYHMINLLIHVLNGILVFFLSKRIIQKLCSLTTDFIFFMSLFSALLFVVHPLQTQAVTYIAQRYTSLAALFYLMSVLCFMIARDVGIDHHRFLQYLAYTLSITCGLFAFFCKQNAASLPLMIVLMEYGCYDQTWTGWKQKIKWVLLGMVLFGLVYAYNLGVFSRDIQFDSFLEDVFEAVRETREFSRWQYLCTQFNVISIYIRLLFIPVHQNLDYLYPIKDGFFDGATPYLFVFLVGILALSLWQRKKHPIVFIGILWFFISLSVESSIFPIKDAMFEHRLYLPMFGFSLLLSYGIFLAFSAYRYWIFGVSVTIVLSLAVATYHRNEIWKNAVSLWSDVVKKNPSNYRGITNLAYALEQAGKTEAAISYYDQAIKLKPDYYYALSNKGAMLGLMGKNVEAIELFQKALHFKPSYPSALNNMGVSLASQKKFKEAIDYFKKAIKIRPEYLDAHINLATAFQEAGDYENALLASLEIIQLDPENAAMHNRAGVLLHIQQRYTEAIKQYNDSIILDPTNAEVYHNKGNSQLADKLFDNAVDSYKLAIQNSPDMIESVSNMGVAYMRLKRYDEAIDAFIKVLKIDPNRFEAHANLGVIYYLQGNILKSLEHMNVARRLKPDSIEMRNSFEKVFNERIKIADQ